MVKCFPNDIGFNVQINASSGHIYLSSTLFVVAGKITKIGDVTAHKEQDKTELSIGKNQLQQKKSDRLYELFLKVNR
jgi:hypothetical protein